MGFCYNKLWKLLIDKGLKKKDLCNQLGLSPSTVAKLTHGETVTTDVLYKLCSFLNCDVGDIMQKQATAKETENDPILKRATLTISKNSTPLCREELHKTLMLEGIDTDSGMARCLGNQKLYEQMLVRFSDGSRIRKIKNYLEKNNIVGLKNSVHEINGVSGNLSMKTLYSLTLSAKEFLKSDKLSEFITLLPEIEEEYNRITNVITNAFSQNTEV